MARAGVEHDPDPNGEFSAKWEQFSEKIMLKTKTLKSGVRRLAGLPANPPMPDPFLLASLTWRASF
jgi:hypothetical protein